ncbi:MAG: zinc ribbon domain-containing protein [Nitrosomonadales bacterium]|nr:zinc ribbon domain-containing protein [Nitrosomonadales bacterium]
MAIFCSHCGTAIQNDARFCSSCGKPTAFLHASSEPSQKPANKNMSVLLRTESKTPVFSL